ncbi:MAG: NAD(P)/FAD-dependent oxidoreductase [Promethearchaeota archaeon]|nr:MAG: NAD(P)/FAD-dependent oxidoreductase [Candidatus Lokiarchaeota archaeon]
MKYDCVIAGGGPAGATCAEILGKNGIEVIMFEKGGENRYKCCAGGLMWHNELDFGLLPPELVEREVEHLFLSGPTQSVNLCINDNSSKLGQLVYRNRFDSYLREQAAKKGVIIELNSEVINAECHKNFIEVEVKHGTETRNVKADSLVIAVGLHDTKLQQKLRIDRPTDVEQAINAEFHLPRKIIEERFGGGAYDLYFDSRIASHGYFWIFTKKEGLSIGLCDKVVNIEHFRNIISHHPIIAKKLEGAKPLPYDGKHIWAANIPDRIPEYIYQNRILLVGDAAGFSDRFTYEGIWHARLSGKFAAETLIKAKKREDFSASQLQSYQKKCAKIFRLVLNSQRMHHVAYHTGYLDLIIDTVAEILHKSTLAEKIVPNIQIILEGFLDLENKVTSLSMLLQQELLDALRSKVNRTTWKKINQELEFALSLS